MKIYEATQNLTILIKQNNINKMYVHLFHNKLKYK